jgi:type IV pilus assembly protein PilM
MGIFSKKCLGVDIGASSVKLVEVSVFGKRRKLENYAEFSFFPENSPVKTFLGDSLVLDSEKASEILRAVLTKGEFEEKKAAFSIPDFSTFFTTFSLPLMSKEEVPHAVEFEARHHIPLPLSEVAFDWQVMEKEESFPGAKLKILLVAVPKRILQEYQRLAELTKIKLKGMEAEVFGLIHSSIRGKYEEPICLVDIGWLSTTVSIVDRGNLKVSHSFDFSSKKLTESLSSALGITFIEAERLKREKGLDPREKDVIKTLLPLVGSLAVEIEKVCEDFYKEENKLIKRLVLAGGSATLFGLKEYLAGKTKKETELVNPFSGFVYPEELEPRLKEIGPSFAVATGVALMGIES